MRRGGGVVFRCANARGPLVVRFYQRNRLKGAVATRVRGRGGAAVRARGLRRGAYTVTAWRGNILLGNGPLSIR